MIMEGRRFSYGLIDVGELKAGEVRTDSSDRRVAHRLMIKGVSVQTTPRFWSSFSRRFGISENVFRYFDHNEVFKRVADRAPNATVRYCIEHNPTDRVRLLAVTSPNRPVPHCEELVDLIEQHGGEDLQYGNGLLRSLHVPKGGTMEAHIGADTFQRQFVLESPVDGFGNPRIYISMLREVCQNGMVAYAPAFRSEISVGQDVSHSLRRALRTYDNGEGYSALRQRFESAQTSWASIHEVQTLYRVLAKQLNYGHLKPDVLMRLDKLAGHLQERYGLANLEALSTKRQRVLPAECRVYDLLNYASELATHHAVAEGVPALQAFIGTMVSDEFDMEGTASSVQDFKDFFVPTDPSEPQQKSA